VPVGAFAAAAVEVMLPLDCRALRLEPIIHCRNSRFQHVERDAVAHGKLLASRHKGNSVAQVISRP
jgi:hypothetical protein